METLDTLNQIFIKSTIIDLSQTINVSLPAAPGHNPYLREICNSPDLGDISISYKISLNEHTGTHVDAPLHFIYEELFGKSIEQLELRSFICRCKVLKFLDKEGGDFIAKQEIVHWEEKNSPINPSEGVLFHTGWDKLVTTCAQDGRFIANWPGLGLDAVEYLIEKKIRLVGIDTVCIDSSNSTTFPAHKKLLEQEIPIYENLNNLGKIDKECFFIALPLRIEGGSASPVRAIAIV